MIVVATVIAVIPAWPGHQPLLVGVQVVNGLLLPINLFFIWRLSRSHKLMGEHRNRGTLDGLAAITVAITSTLSIILVAVTVLDSDPRPDTAVTPPAALPHRCD